MYWALSALIQFIEMLSKLNGDFLQFSDCCISKVYLVSINHYSFNFQLTNHLIQSKA